MTADELLPEKSRNTEVINFFVHIVYQAATEFLIDISMSVNTLSTFRSAVNFQNTTGGILSDKQLIVCILFEYSCMVGIILIFRERIFLEIVITIADISTAQIIPCNVQGVNIILLQIRIDFQIDAPLVLKEEIEFLLIGDDYRDFLNTRFPELTNLTLDQRLTILHKQTFWHRVN